MKFLDPEKGLHRRYCTVFGIDDAMMVGTAANVGGNIFSSIFGAGAAKQQAQAIRDAAETAKKTALELNDRARADVQPFRDMGVKAGNSLTDLLFGGGDTKSFLQSSDLFNFQSDIGTRNMNRDLKAKGLYGSGAGLEQLARFNNQLVSEEGQRTYDRLFGLTQLGSNAAAQQASNTTQTGNTLADMFAKTGMAQAGAIGDAGRSIASIGTGVAGAVNTGLTNYANYSLYSPTIKALADRLASRPAAPSGVSLSIFGG